MNLIRFCGLYSIIYLISKSIISYKLHFSWYFIRPLIIHIRYDIRKNVLNHVQTLPAVEQDQSK